MGKRNLFIKKNNRFHILFIITIFIFFFIFLFYFYYINKKEFYSIPKYTNSFYFIPENKGGQNIPNQDKKGLHLSYYEDDNLTIIKDKKIKYSIQIFSNNNFNLVNNKRINILVNKNMLFVPNDFVIAVFDSGLGKEFFLLYKNFDSRLKAHEYCQKYVYFLDNCLIVNAQNLE